MDKRLDWASVATPVTVKKAGKYASMREKFEQGMAVEAERKEKEVLLMKAMPIMQNLLQSKLLNKSEILVKSSIQYQTSKFDSQSSRFELTTDSIPRGTSLTLVQFNPSIQEFTFRDQRGKEYDIPYTTSLQLMTHTDIFEESLQYINDKE